MIEDRIQQLIEDKGLSHSRFAQEIGVERANISHIFSGRNQASIGLVRKILERYPEVSADWLIMGRENNAAGSPDDEAASPSETREQRTDAEDIPIPPPEDPNKRIERIVIFYDDKTFASYSGM